MWQPKSEAEILTALSNGSLEETNTFDAKSELPPKNLDLAKDVSALANTAGGVILIGIKEDSNKRLTIATPFELKGQRERIEQIIQTSISEIPKYKLKIIETESDPSKGYIVLLIEHSERAPHMVIVKGDQRYYGRAESKNYILTEAEVACLYERREITRSDTLALLDELIDNDPLKEDKDFIHLHILIKPVLSSDSFLDELQNSIVKKTGFERSMPDILDMALKTALRPHLFKEDGHYKGLSKPGIWRRRVEGYYGDVYRGGYNDRLESSDALHLWVNFDGSGSLFCGWIGRVEDKSYTPRKNFYREITAIMTARFLAFWGEIYKNADYLGKVDLGLAVTHLEQSVDSEISSNDIRPDSGFYKPDYKRTLRISASDLKDNPKHVTEELLTRLFESIAPTKKNMFKLGGWK